MEHLNELLFLAISASDQASAFTVAVARFIAQWIVPLGGATILGLWIWGRPNKRGALVTATIGLLAGLGINQALGLVWFHPRPFMVGSGRTLMSHPPENSFPSDHATFLWRLGFGLIATMSWRLWGWLLVVFGLATGWARVYLGLHFPFDMAGSFFVALTATTLIRALHPQVQRWLVPPAEALYELLLCWLRFPAAIFPRRPPLSREAK